MVDQEERNKRFEAKDKAALDLNGKQIEFGRDYTYNQFEEKAVVTTVGLDLRSPGWVMVWMHSVRHGHYTCVLATHLTKIEQT